LASDGLNSTVGARRAASTALSTAESNSNRWDREYRRGDWSYLRDASESPRYAALAGCIVMRLATGTASVLDLGCGPGILREHLPDRAIARYTGIDLSKEAVASARSPRRRGSAFMVASIDEWQPDQQYDAIVFNEVLYYLPQPLDSMRRYEHWLKPDGSLYVSMWHPSAFLRLFGPRRGKVAHARRQYGRIWDKIDSRYDVATDLTAHHSSLQRWRIKELRPRLVRTLALELAMLVKWDDGRSESVWRGVTDGLFRIVEE
jgi:SAM-dependent methyltransferase